MRGRKRVGLDGISAAPGPRRNLVGTRPRPIRSAADIIDATVARGSAKAIDGLRFAEADRKRR